MDHTAFRRFARRCIVAAGVVALWGAVLVTGVGGPVVARDTSSVGLFVAAISAAAACVAASFRSGDRTRRTWRLLAGFAGSWGVGQVVWTVYESLLGIEPFPSLADAGYLMAVPLVVAALLASQESSGGVAARVRAVLDGLLIGCSLLVVSWILVLGPLVRGGVGWDLSFLISLAYPLADVVVLTIATSTLLRARRHRGTRDLPIGTIVAGLVAFSVADTGFAYLSVTEAYSSGGVIDLGWGAGFVLLLLAALQPSRHDQPAVASEDELRGADLLLPYGAVMLALATSAVELLRTGDTDPVVSWLRTFTLGALVVRQLLVLLENRSLTADLKDRMRQLGARERRFSALVQHSSDVVTIVDPAGLVGYCSRSVQRVFGYEPEGLNAHPLGDVLDPQSRIRFGEALAAAVRDATRPRVLELFVVHRTGRPCLAEMTITNLVANPAVGGLVLNTRDISERKKLEDQLVHEAFHDSLTALPNRSLFREQLERMVVASASGAAPAVLFCDLDGFKKVNDSLGHASGDLLLMQVADRLRSCIRPGDVVARLGGDEFGVLLDDASRGKDALAVAERIREGLRAPFVVDGRTVPVGVSIGLSVAEPGISGEVLLRNADLAMYRAKSNPEHIEAYEETMHAEMLERVELELDLRRALDNGEFVLHYQPAVVLTDGALAGVEALVRWEHPRRGLVPPGEFIPLAEDTGLICPLGSWILGEACQQMSVWRQRHGRNFSVYVNISGRQLLQPGFVEEVAGVLARTGVPPADLVLEMTESVLMERTDETLDLLRSLKRLGVRLAIDDFGTGYSSLAYLHAFPVDVLKIDRSFVERLSEESGDSEVVATIVRLGQTLGMMTVAEGIEDPRQLSALIDLGCDLGQGWHFARAMPASDIDPLVLAQAPLPAVAPALAS